MSSRPHPLAQQRRAGVLLHVSSLPSGKLDADAYRFVDLLADSGFRIWQILPLCPTDAEGSPYNGSSAFAGNPQFIDTAEILLSHCGVERQPVTVDIDFWVNAARLMAETSRELASEYAVFVNRHRFWLQEYAQYVLLKAEFGGSWVSWPAPYRKREAEALQAFSSLHQSRIEAIFFQQFLFYRQWFELKRYANERGILIVGDMPIFVAHDSADCWAHQDQFLLQADGNPSFIAGVPPDYFSATGQRWGNPQYDWDAIVASDFHWWMQRFQFCFDCFDLIRVDHFRGFQACWFIPAAEPLAINGYWQEIPGAALFTKALEVLGELPIIAEDLGIITPEVEKLRDDFGLPGMKILQFAFDGSPDNPYLPAYHIANCVLYTGTHDNDTLKGWFDSLTEADLERIAASLDVTPAAIPQQMIATVLQSVANTAVVPMQDWLGLGGEARMNTPGTVEDNWRWRFSWNQLPADFAETLFEMNRRFDRCS